jgi:hypothetical protein
MSDLLRGIIPDLVSETPLMTPEGHARGYKESNPTGYLKDTYARGVLLIQERENN